ncbi:MAG: PP2C family protein-serine/threonine phosphatase [Candidatus Acidiferrales bacterium]|jgi:serine phosphatase RsbU (regulator of sigma subunit)
MAFPPQPATKPGKPHRERPSRGFWQRITDGLALNELWDQFRVEARTTYRLYSRDIDSARPEGGKKKGRVWWVIQFFWAVLDKLSPARRVLLLIALYFIINRADVDWTTKSGTHLVTFDLRFWGGMLMFLLLILEIGDRVTMKRDLQIAREIQTWLLPSAPPEIPGVQIAFDTRPANTVAGDYYDVVARPVAPAANLPTYLIVVADVVGKSIPAAMLMAALQANMRTLSAIPSSLEALASGMNGYACSNSMGGLRFTTAFIAEYQPATRALTYVNAGHNWPILRRTGGQIERLDRGGLPLGVQADSPYKSASTELKSGDWLVIFTDGVVEAVNDKGAEYGEARLISVLNAGAEFSPVQMLANILADLAAFVGNTPQHDDITCLLIKAV